MGNQAYSTITMNLESVLFLFVEPLAIDFEVWEELQESLTF